MTTPTFRDWAVMHERASWEFLEYDDVWSEEFLLYILSRIERKEKALRETVSIGQDIAWKAITLTVDHAERFRLERSRIAERVRAEADGKQMWYHLADDIKEGKV